MSPLYLLLFLPTLPIVGYMVYDQWRERNLLTGLTMALPAVVVFINAGLVQQIMQQGDMLWLRWFSMLLCTTIVPQAYMYFAHEMGRKASNGTTITLWSLLLLLLLPHAIFLWHGETTPLDPAQVRPWAIQVVRDGQMTFSMLTGDLIVTVQALLTMSRMIPFVKTLHRYGLKISPKVYFFGVWWILTIIFLVSVSLMHISQLATTLGSWFYFGGSSLLLCSIYILLALRFDLHPQTAEGESVENVDELEKQLKMMAIQVRMMVDDQQLYLHPGYSTRDITAALGTNRTYFSRMMQQEFGCSFAEYLNEKRLKHAQRLLLTTDGKLEEIAEQSGFSDASHLSHAFKDALGLTPRQWQKENEKEKE